MATTLTVGGGNFVRPYRLYGNPLQVRTFPESAGQSFVPGEPLILDGGGAGAGNRVKVAANDPVASIVGIAVHGATGVTGNFTGWGSRTDPTALAAGTASTLGPGVAGSLGQGIGGSYLNVGNVATLQGNGNTKGLIQVYVAMPDTLFIAHSLDGQSILASHVGSQFGFEKDATNLIWRVDNGDAANKVVQIVELFDEDGTINGRYIFKFVAATKLYGER